MGNSWLCLLKALAKRVYDVLTMARFIASNGQEVEKVVTPSGGTVYIDASVSPVLLDAMLVKVRARLAEIAKERADGARISDHHLRKL